MTTSMNIKHDLNRFWSRARWLSLAGIAISSSSYAIDIGVASDQLYNRPGGIPKIESMETIQRVRIPVVIQSWNNVTTKTRDGVKQDARIAQKPISHILRARIEKPNDFYVGDWRIQSTPIRWLKNTSQYQVRLELFRRYGEAGQIEESVGSVNLTGVLEKQSDGLYLIQGNAKRRFNDSTGQPIASLEVGSPEEAAPAAAISKGDTGRQQIR